MAADNVASNGAGAPAVDEKRRRLLTTGIGVVGALGAATMAIPFVSSMSPSARAKAAGAPVEIDISLLEPGQRVTVEWRGKPVRVVGRTPESLDTLEKLDGELRDIESDKSEQPEYAKNVHRSIKPEV